MSWSPASTSAGAVKRRAPRASRAWGRACPCGTTESIEKVRQPVVVHRRHEVPDERLEPLLRREHALQHQRHDLAREALPRRPLTIPAGTSSASRSIRSGARREPYCDESAPAHATSGRAAARAVQHLGEPDAVVVVLHRRSRVRCLHRLPDHVDRIDAERSSSGASSTSRCAELAIAPWRSRPAARSRATDEDVRVAEPRRDGRLSVGTVNRARKRSCQSTIAPSLCHP